MISAYYNGIFSELCDVKIPLSDRAVFFGDGIYDAAIGRCGRIFLEKEHINRFFTNAKAMDIPTELKTGSLSSLLHELIEKSGLSEYFIYFQLSRYSEERTHSYPETKRSNLLITVKPFSLLPRDRELALITANDIRYRMCNVKTLNLLPAVLASKRAADSGCDEAVFIRDGFVTECAHSNISILKNGILKTHPNGELILPGITRERMLYFCRLIGVPVDESPFTKDEMMSADAVIVTSTSKLAATVSTIDGHSVGIRNFPLANKLVSCLRQDFLA